MPVNSNRENFDRIGAKLPRKLKNELVEYLNKENLSVNQWGKNIAQKTIENYGEKKDEERIEVLLAKEDYSKLKKILTKKGLSVQQWLLSEALEYVMEKREEEKK